MNPGKLCLNMKSREKGTSDIKTGVASHSVPILSDIYPTRGPAKNVGIAPITI
jgi:hypothetical protein